METYIPGQVKVLTWQANQEVDFDHYEIQQAPSDDGPWAVLGTSEVESYSIQISDLPLGYNVFRLIAIDFVGNRSDPSVVSTPIWVAEPLNPTSLNPTSVDIKDMLEAESSLGLAFETNLYVGLEPTQPTDCVTIFDTPGFPPMLTLDKTEIYEYPSIQIRVRNNDYLVGEVLANDIKTFLHGKNHETWNETMYTLIKCVIPPFLLGWTKANAAWFVTNFDIQRR